MNITEEKIVCGEKIIKIAHNKDAAEKMIKAGEKVVYVPSADDKLPGTYCTDFWCYPMFRSISESMNKPVPVGTMGLLIDRQNKLLKEFPTNEHSEPQWFNIVMHSHCEDLDGTEIIPTVWVIDNPDRAKKLGLLYEIGNENGKITVCTSRLWEIADKPEVKWFAKSLADNL